MQQRLARAKGRGGVLDDRSPMPLYHQVYLVLRDKIAAGDYAMDAMLPGEPELAREFGVSRITARRALDELAGEGLVRRERGRGTRVVQSAASAPIRSSIEQLQDHLRTMGRRTQANLIEFAYVPAPPDVSYALRITPGSEVQRALRIRSLDGQPFSHLTTFVPAAIGRRYEDRDLRRRPLLELLESQGISISAAEQSVGATLADARVAALLQVAVGAPLLRIRRTVLDQSARPVEYIVGLYRPDRFQLQMRLEREGDAVTGVWSPAPSAGPRKSKRNRNNRES